MAKKLKQLKHNNRKQYCKGEAQCLVTARVFTCTQPVRCTLRRMATYVILKPVFWSMRLLGCNQTQGVNNQNTDTRR